MFVVNAQQQQQAIGIGGVVVVVSYTARVHVNGIWYDAVDEKATKNAARVAAAVEALRVLDSIVG